eukprot:Hpha_TRINITY_DN33844_c0_g1::TRINITY_DN33844_c0_g1_i1::g.27339::m.27339
MATPKAIPKVLWYPCDGCAKMGYAGIKNHDVVRLHPDMVNRGKQYCDDCWKEKVGSIHPKCSVCSALCYNARKGRRQFRLVVREGKVLCCRCAGIEEKTKQQLLRESRAIIAATSGQQDEQVRAYMCHVCRKLFESWAKGGFCQHWGTCGGADGIPRPKRKEIARLWVHPDKVEQAEEKE